ncbi:hypothetical protein FB566_1442 [Stackebrandtia endophytica]|uniref:DUF7144 domain-containing protein n=1 Tax=Stackebrandtia endophytica TaxID=1496996 RepID=A0A543ATU6_9ACTN|nr:hypothetical protein [Stackebrandtia endophytica]TQL75925.1 hypothetical protein FB566_1442 [Stackebrandtia endophytica]
MPKDSTRQSWAMGGTIFAATAMIVLGFFQVVVGLAALANDQVFVTGPDYVYSVDISIWGWAHLGLGVIMVITGIALYGMSAWARGVGIALAVLSAVANFLFAPYFPLWSVVIIALDVFVIWALATVHSPADSAAMSDRRHHHGHSHGEGDLPMNRPVAGRESNEVRKAEKEAEVRREAEM